MHFKVHFIKYYRSISYRDVTQLCEDDYLIKETWQINLIELNITG